MEQNKINEELLHVLASSLTRLCSRFAFVGEVNKDWQTTTKIHILCSVKENERNLNEPVEAANKELLKEATDNRNAFNDVKIQLENFTYDDYLTEFHERFPEISILVEEVSENEFPFAELSRNSSEDFYEYALQDFLNFEDPLIRPDWSVEDRYTGEKIIFKNERELMECLLGYFVPVHLRFNAFHDRTIKL